MRFLILYHDRIAECITAAFKVIERRSSLQNYSEYKCLRDIFSHPPPYYPKTITDFIKEFPPNSFDFSEYNPGNKTIILNLGSTKTRKSAVYSLLEFR